MSRSSPPRDRRTKTGLGEGHTPSVDEEVSGPQHHDDHVQTMRTWIIHERCSSVLIVQAQDTAIVTIRWSQITTTSRNTWAGSHFQKYTHRSWSSFRYCLFRKGKVLKHPGKAVARLQNGSCSMLRWSSSTGQQLSLTHCNTNTHQNAVLQTLSEISRRLGSEAKSWCASVAKHARQLSLACFVNTRRLLGSRARFHLHQSLWRHVERDW